MNKKEGIFLLVHFRYHGGLHISEQNPEYFHSMLKFFTTLKTMIGTFHVCELKL